MNLSVGMGAIIFAVVLCLIGIGASYFGSNPRVLYFAAFGICIFVLYGTHEFVKYLEEGAPPFSAEWKITIATGESGNFFSHAAPQTFATKIRLPAFIIITNLQKTAVTVDSYRIEFSQDADGPWIRIDTIQRGYDVFMLSGPHVAGALNLRECGFDFSIFNRSIEPGGVAQGWIFMPKPYEPVPYSRIVLTDTAGNTATIPFRRLDNARSNAGNVIGGDMTFFSGTFDISSLSLKDPDAP